MIQALPRSRYVELYGPEWDTPAPATPSVVNIDAVLGLYEPTTLAWNGVEYRIAPVSYLDGVRFARLESALKRAAEASSVTGVEHGALQAQIVNALERMHAHLIPMPGTNPFLEASPVEVRQLLGFFLDAPDDAKRVRPKSDGKTIPFDHVDALCEFAREYPAWMHAGVPHSWRHFVYGLANISRARAAETLRRAQAAGAAYMEKGAAKEWSESMRRAAGYVWRR